MKRRTPKQLESLGEIPQILRDLVLTNASEAMFVGLGLVVAEANTRFARLFGYERREDVIGLPYSALATQESVRIAEGRLTERASGGSPASTQLYVYVRKDGEHFTGESSAISWPGEPAITLAIIRDVTERERQADLLQESEKLYRTMAETVPVGVMLTRPSGQRIYVNELIQKMTGYTAEELLAGQWVVDPEDAEARRLYMSAISEGKAGTDLETRVVRKDGKFVPVSISWSPIRADDGTLIGAHATYTDITERKLAEDALRQSEQSLQAVFDGIQDGISVSDRNLTVLRVNRAMEQWYSYGMPICGKKCYEVYRSGRKKPCEVCPSLRAIEQKSLQMDLAPLFGPDGTVVGWFDLYAFPLLDDKGEVYGVIEHVRDVTQRKRAEEAHRESEASLRSFIDAIQHPAFLVDAEGTVILANEAIAGKLGTSVGELEGHKIGAFLSDDAAQHKRAFALQAIESGQPVEFEEETNGATYRHYVAPVFDHDGEVRRVAWVAIDLTDLREAERALRESEALSRTVIEAMQLPVALTDLEGRCLRVNESFADRLGVDSNELIGRNWLDFLPKEIAESRQSYFDEVVRSGKPVEFGDERRDRYYRFYVTPAFDRDGKVSRVAWVAIDLRNLRRAERALRKSEASLRTFINALRHPAALVDTEGMCIVANETLARSYGVSADELVGRDVWQFGPAEVAARRRDRFHEVIRTGEPVEFEDEREGVNFRHYVSPAFDQSGNVSNVAWIALDITDRVALENKLREKELWFSKLVHNIPGAVIRVLLKGNWTIDFTGDAIESITGYPVWRFVGTGAPAYMDLIHPEDKDHLVASVLTALKKRQPFAAEFRILHSDGGIRHCRIRGQGGHDSKGRLAWTDAVVFDITEMQAAQEAAREAQERYRLLAENASDMIYELDLEGKFTYISPGIRALGYEPDEWIGKSFASLFAPHDESALLEAFERDIRDPSPKRYILRVPHKDGTECWRDISVNIVMENGQPVRVQGIARDITASHNAEMALRESEASLRTFIEAIRQPVALTDLEGRCVVANHSLAHRLGVTPGELIGRNWLDFVEPDVAASRQAYFDEVVRSGKRVEFEDERRGRYYRFYVTPAYDQDGKVHRVAWVAVDVSELREAERALRVREVWYRTLVDNIPGAVIRVVVEGDPTLDFMSDEIESITGYPPSYFWGRAGSAFMDLVYPEDQGYIADLVNAALAQDRPFDVEYRLRHRDGSTRFCRARGQGIRDETGSLACVDSIMYDITEMHAAEEAARETERRYRLLAENASDLIWQMDLDGRFTYVSPAVRKYGYEPEEWVGERLPKFLPPHEQAIYAARQTGDPKAPRPARYEVQMLAKDGSLVWMEVLVDFVFQDGAPVLFQGISRDITERRKAEDALRIAHADLERAYKFQQEFLNNVTHEIRTPMTAVKGYVEILLEGMAGPLSEAQTGMLRKVQTSSDSLIELVTNLLEVARLRSGGMGLRPTACKPGEVAAKAASAVAPQAAGKGLTVDVRVVGSDRIGVYDEQKLTMILTNLLSNAVKFTIRGGVEVTVSSQQSGVEIIVVDSGMGIRQADLPTVFDEFQQLDYPSKYKPSGFGLGLAIVSAAVENTGACLVVSSRRGIGTAFTLWVPHLKA